MERHYDKLQPQQTASLLLASASPRRRAILQALAIPFDTLDPSVDESPSEGESPRRLAQRLALSKASAGARLAPGSVAIGADTVVVLDSEALGKPVDATEARRMLSMLRAREHQVITSVATARVEPGRGHLVSASRLTTTRVWMRDYTDAEIEAYIARGEPFDKAGAYAIQDNFFRPCARVEGCYLGVVGLPVHDLADALGEIGFILPVTGSHVHADCLQCAVGSQSLGAYGKDPATDGCRPWTTASGTRGVP